MKIDYSLYRKNNLVIPAIGIISLMLFTAVNVCLLFKNLHTPKSIHYYIFSIIVAIIAMIAVSVLLPRGLKLITENESDAVVTEGEITNIEWALDSPKYYIGGKHCRAVLICIGDEKYYMVDTHELSVGDKVQLTYLKNSRFVIEYDKEWENEGE